jgi:hypothetical protein
MIGTELAPLARDYDTMQTGWQNTDLGGCIKEVCDREITAARREEKSI